MNFPDYLHEHRRIAIPSGLLLLSHVLFAYTGFWALVFCPILCGAALSYRPKPDTP